MRVQNAPQVIARWLGRVTDACSLDRERLLILFDAAENRARRNKAEINILQNAARGWKPNTWDVDTVAKGEDADIHGCFAPGELLAAQELPDFAKAAVQSDESLIYIDRVYLAGDIIESVLTLAEECRHAWQYYAHPIVFWGANVLSWVMPPHETPAEIDAEIFSKRLGIEFFGLSDVENFARKQINSAPLNHRWRWQRFLSVDASTEYNCPVATEETLLDRAMELRQQQRSLNVDFPNLDKVAGYLRQPDRARFLAAAKR